MRLPSRRRSTIPACFLDIWFTSSVVVNGPWAASGSSLSAASRTSSNIRSRLRYGSLVASCCPNRRSGRRADSPARTR